MAIRRALIQNGRSSLNNVLVNMKKYYLIILLSLLLSPSAFAEDDPYAICSIGGFFRGTDNKFMAGITTHIITRKKIFTNPTCISLHNQSFQLGRSLLAGDNINKQHEIKIINAANDFREKVYETISKKMGY